jgi:uncharacterized RDD family membrane protein YckC
MSSLPDPVSQSAFYQGVPAKRALAWVIDTLLIAGLTVLVLPFTGFLALFFLGGLYLVLGFLYRWISLARSSATPGMRLFAIEFRTGLGERFDPGIAFAHTLGYSLSMAFVFPQLLSIALMLLTPRGQGLTDHILGTVALYRAG